MVSVFQIHFLLAVILFSSCATHRHIEKTDKTAATDQLLMKNASINEKYVFTYRGKEFVGYPNV